ncbi:MAG: protein-L-isoaspartate O-methyltransferase [Lentisphaerae bacterium GWF2_45_14]|nr:MAG: protein-L-isoaspartate O-methyltransferase [Lentisphaerae bacterium GWF2_45_14]
MDPDKKDIFKQMRLEMVYSQLTPRGIKNNAVLEAMNNVPREIFVTEENIPVAYHDCPLPLFFGQTISQPYIVALMTELLKIPEKAADTKILEVGTGSGYQAAVLAYIGCRVTSVERIPDLASFARINLAKLPYADRITIVNGDGSEGFTQASPYDRIIVTAAAPEIPPELVEQLARGGRMVIPCGDLFTQQLIVVDKASSGKISLEKGIACRFVPLIGKEGFESC